VLMRKVLQVCLALLLLALGSGLLLHSWRAEGRDKADVTFLLIEEQDNQARKAQWILDLLPKLGQLEARLGALQPGTPEYAMVRAELDSARNLIAEKDPTLVTGTDGNGNASLEPLDVIQMKLKATISLAQSQSRTLLSAHKSSAVDLKTMPQSIQLSQSPKELLVDGWYDSPGLGYRFTMKTATCMVRNNPDKKRVKLRLMYPESLGAAKGTVFVNNKKVGTFTVASSIPADFTYEKPPGSYDVLRVKLVNDVLSVPDKLTHNGDKRPLGVAVIRITQE